MWVYVGMQFRSIFLNVNLYNLKVSYLLIFFHRDAFLCIFLFFSKKSPKKSKNRPQCDFKVPVFCVFQMLVKSKIGNIFV